MNALFFTKFRSRHNTLLVDCSFLMTVRILGFRIFKISTLPKQGKPLSSVIRCPEKVLQLDLSKVGTRSSIDVALWFPSRQITLSEKLIALA